MYYISCKQKYAIKIGTGVIWLLTGGVCGIGWLVDLIMVIAGKYTDKDGNVWGTN